MDSRGGRTGIIKQDIFLLCFLARRKRIMPRWIKETEGDAEKKKRKVRNNGTTIAARRTSEPTINTRWTFVAPANQSLDWFRHCPCFCILLFLRSLSLFLRPAAPAKQCLTTTNFWNVVHSRKTPFALKWRLLTAPAYCLLLFSSLSLSFFTLFHFNASSQFVLVVIIKSCNSDNVRASI